MKTKTSTMVNKDYGLSLKLKICILGIHDLLTNTSLANLCDNQYIKVFKEEIDTILKMHNLSDPKCRKKYDFKNLYENTGIAITAVKNDQLREGRKNVSTALSVLRDQMTLLRALTRQQLPREYVGL